MINVRTEKAFSIEIRPAVNGGWTCQVGCEMFIIPDDNTMINAIGEELKAYLKDPGKYIKSFRQKRCHEPALTDREKEEVPVPTPYENMGFGRGNE